MYSNQGGNMPNTPIHYSSLTGLPIGTQARNAPGSLPSGPTQAGHGAYGTVPTVPNPIDTQASALGGNLGNLASLYGLTTGTSAASAAGAATQYGANLPLYGQLTQQGSQNILNDLQGLVSPDVTNQLGILAAQRGVGFGGGSPNANAALLAALGKTSMGLQAQGQQELTSAIGRTPVGPAFNPASFLVSPGDMQSAQYAANVFGAAPNPAAAANAGLKQAQTGFGAGLGSMPNFGGVGGGGGRDALGFPITPDTGYGAGGPGMMVGGALGAPSTSNPNQAAANWNQWWNSGGQGTPWSGSYGQMTGEEAYQIGETGDFGPVGESNQNLSGFSGMPQTGEEWPGYTGSLWGGNDFGSGDVFSDIEG